MVQVCRGTQPPNQGVAYGPLQRQAQVLELELSSISVLNDIILVLLGRWNRVLFGCLNGGWIVSAVGACLAYVLLTALSVTYTQHGQNLLIPFTGPIVCAIEKSQELAQTTKHELGVQESKSATSLRNRPCHCPSHAPPQGSPSRLHSVTAMLMSIQTSENEAITHPLLGAFFHRLQSTLPLRFSTTIDTVK